MTDVIRINRPALPATWFQALPPTSSSTVFGAAAYPVAVQAEIAHLDPFFSIPTKVVTAFAAAATEIAVLEEIEPGQWFVDLDALDGVWGEGDSAQAAKEDFHASVISWVALKLRDGDKDIPEINGVSLPKKA